jgi:hypothetical protein
VASLVGRNQDRFTSLIVINKVFEPVDRKDVPQEKQSRIFNLLILLKRKWDQFGEITKQKSQISNGWF